MKHYTKPKVFDEAAWHYFPWLVILGCLWAYHNSFTGPFIFDDTVPILENPHIRRLWPLWEPLAPTPPASWRPIVSLSLAINYALGGFAVWGYHAVNLALHICAALALFGIVRLTLNSPRLSLRYAHQAAGLATAVALVWAVHPLLTESVTYIIQRSELLMGLFLLLSLYCTIRSENSSRAHAWHTAALAACALGVASKEAMIVAPILVALYDRTFLSNSIREAWQKRRCLYVGLAATWLIFLALRSHPQASMVAFHVGEITPLRYAYTQTEVILHYLRLAFWPSPLVLDYGDWPIAKSLADVWPQALLVVGLLGLALLAFRRCPPIGFLGAWFLILLAPTSSFIPIVTEIAAERRMYLPLAAIAALVAFGAWEIIRRAICKKSWRSGVAVAVLTAAALGLGSLTIKRNQTYRTEVSIWADTLMKRPANARACYNLGAAFLKMKSFENAAALLEEAIRLNPSWADPRENLGLAYANLNRFPEAIDQLTEAIRMKPDAAWTHNNLGTVLAKQGKLEDALAHFRRAVQLDPDLVTARQNFELAQRQLRAQVESESH